MNDAIALVGDSACRGANRLQFYRFAYGSAMAGATPHELANRIFDAARIVCDYRESVRALPLDWQKLACNLLLVGAETLPRGGRLVLAADPLDLEAVGEGAALSPQTVAALTLVTPLDALTSRTAQAYFTGLLAEALGCRLVCTKELRRVRLTAVALAA